MAPADDRCARLAERQQGCISLGQALACGLSRDGVFRRARTGRWERLLPQVYRVRGSPDTWEQRLFAALLWGGDGAALSGASAAALWRFPGFGPGPVEVSITRGTRPPRGVVVRRTRLDREEITTLSGLTLTSAERTLVDVATRAGPSCLDAAVHYCLHERLARLSSLRRVAEQTRPGAAKLRDVVTAYGAAGPAAGSPLEARCARLLHRSGLPAPRRQHEVWAGGRRRVIDFAWPEERVALEIDGYRWHSSRRSWESDRARTRDLRRAGWTVIHATHDDLTVGCARLLSELAALVAR